MHHWKHGTDVIFIYRLGNDNKDYIRVVTHTFTELHPNLSWPESCEVKPAWYADLSHYRPDLTVRNYPVHLNSISNIVDRLMSPQE